MAEARERRGARRAPRRARRAWRLRRRATAPLARMPDMRRAADFRRAEDDRTAAEDAGCDGALDCLRRGGECHAARHHRRHEPVLGNRDQRGVEDPALRRCRELAGDEEPGVIGESDVADEVLAKVVAPYDDRFGIRRRDGRLLRRPGNRSSFRTAPVHGAIRFRIPKRDSTAEHADALRRPASSARRAAFANSHIEIDFVACHAARVPRRAGKPWGASPRDSW